MLRERPNEAQISAPLRLRHLRRARSLRTSPYTRIPAKIHSKARSFLSCHVSRAVRVSPHPCEGSSSLSGRAALDANAAKEAGIHSYSQTSEPSALALTTAVANNLNEPGAPLATIPPSHGPLTAHASISPEATPKQATDPARSGSSAIRTRNETLKQTRALVRAGLQEALQDIVAQLLVIDGQKQANETSSATSKSASLCPHLSRQRSITVGENCAVTDLAAELDPSPESSDEDSQLEPMDSDEDEFSRKICGTGVEGHDNPNPYVSCLWPEKAPVITDDEDVLLNLDVGLNRTRRASSMQREVEANLICNFAERRRCGGDRRADRGTERKFPHPTEALVEAVVEAVRSLIGENFAARQADDLLPSVFSRESSKRLVAREISIPARAPAAYTTLARWLAVIKAALEALSCSQVTTQRDIFYTDVTLFGSQSIANRVITNLSGLLGVRRNALGVVASPRGLFSGRIRLEFDEPSPSLSGVADVENNTEDHYNREGRAHNLPIRMTRRFEDGHDGIASIVHDSSMIESVRALGEIKWILAVEKEAAFKSLCESKITAGLGLGIGQGVLLTGRGYPDQATTDFLALLTEYLPRCPIFALVDADPHGIDILRNYRSALKHNALSRSNDVTVDITDGDRDGDENGGSFAGKRGMEPDNDTSNSLEDQAKMVDLSVRKGVESKIRWLGLRRREIAALSDGEGRMIAMTQVDKLKAISLLQRQDMPDDERLELAMMLHGGTKAEIETQKQTGDSAAVVAMEAVAVVAGSQGSLRQPEPALSPIALPSGYCGHRLNNTAQYVIERLQALLPGCRVGNL